MKDLLKFRVKAFALIAILLLSVVGGLSAKKIAIIDAGSSGSRLYVYDIDVNTKVLTVLYPIGEVQKAASKGDTLSKIDNNQTAVTSFLTTMTSRYKVPEDEAIDLYVLATAGMRLVNGVTASEIYDKMGRTSLTGYELKGAMTISGQYEGLYAWIAANYKNGKLRWTESRWSLDGTYGILEIGGASMQIAFIAPGHHSKNCIAHSKFGQIYSKSYLGGGADQVFEKNSPTPQSYFGVILDDIEGMFSSNTEFIGLGTPIKVASEKALGLSCTALNRYVSTMNSSNHIDTQANYHPKINAEYMMYVFNVCGLDEKIKLAEKMSDWTEGAAIDIVINGKQPEPFNYPPAIPN
ncbi:hypothetical protein [Bacteroides sp.]|uniref:hypothetical protein n=1 Tax=Bacteroides sp. TaxID=29523 RepID=UPI002632AB06|nr:hypothetical protein [Bacteroides sp.]